MTTSESQVQRFRTVVIDSPTGRYFEHPDIETRTLAPFPAPEVILVENPAELVGQIEDADAVISWHTVPLQREILARLQHCKGIVRAAVGYDNIDIEFAAERGIPVANVPNYGTEEVADHTLGLILSRMRHLGRLDSFAKAGDWDWRHIGETRRVRGCTLGIVGCGRIGTAVALRAKAFGMEVGFYDPYLPTGSDKSLGIRRFGSLEALARESQIISLHVPLTSETRGLISESVIEQIRTGSILINTSRGEVVDQVALISNLHRLGGLGLDVLAGEPAVPPELRESDSVLLTCHAAFYSDASLAELRMAAASTAAAFLRGDFVRDIVNHSQSSPVRAPRSDEITDASRNWTDWKWQQRDAIRSAEQLKSVFPDIQQSALDRLEKHSKRFRFQATRHYLGLIAKQAGRQAPEPSDPLWRQIMPVSDLVDGGGDDSYVYDGKSENWERPVEMVTPIAQHKYDNRVILRLANTCQSYCQFCFEALRTIDREGGKASMNAADWEATLRYLAQTSSVDEVILSGGEPLIYSDERLDELLGAIRRVRPDILIRIHTRSLTFNPYRVTEELQRILDAHRVSSIGVHVAHPNEISSEFTAAARRLSKSVPILFANIPLLKGINDDLDTMRKLCLQLYARGVVPHYLYHFMPFSPGSNEFRTSVRRGIDLMRGLKRHISNIAVPELVLPHLSGKHTVPLLGRDELPPVFGRDEKGRPVVRYTNWLNESVEYPDEP